MASIGHAAERKAFEIAIRQAVKYVKKEGTDKREQMGKLIDVLKNVVKLNVKTVTLDEFNKIAAE